LTINYNDTEDRHNLMLSYNRCKQKIATDTYINYYCLATATATNSAQYIV